MWESESVLVLGAPDAYLLGLARELLENQALVSLHFNMSIEQTYTLPIEQYSMVLLNLLGPCMDEDACQIGQMLRRAERTMKIVLTSQHFALSSTPSTQRFAFADVLLALPSSAASLARFFEPEPCCSEAYREKL